MKLSFWKTTTLDVVIISVTKQQSILLSWRFQKFDKSPVIGRTFIGRHWHYWATGKNAIVVVVIIFICSSTIIVIVIPTSFIVPVRFAQVEPNCSRMLESGLDGIGFVPGAFVLLGRIHVQYIGPQNEPSLLGLDANGIAIVIGNIGKTCAAAIGYRNVVKILWKQYIFFLNKIKGKTGKMRNEEKNTRVAAAGIEQWE